MSLQKVLHTPLSGAPQKCFQSCPALAKAGPVWTLLSMLFMFIAEWNSLDRCSNNLTACYFVECFSRLWDVEQTCKHARHVLQALWKSDSMLKLFYGKCQQNAAKNAFCRGSKAVS